MTEEVPEEPIYLTPVELAHRWRVSVRSLERWRMAGTGPAWISVGGGIRYAVEAVLDFEALQSGVRARPSKNEGRMNADRTHRLRSQSCNRKRRPGR